MIEFSCSACGKKYKVAEHLAGKKAKCKGCGESLTVPAADSADPVELIEASPPPSRPTPPPLPREVTKATEVANGACPSCQKAMAADAVICIECGYDKRTGKRLPGVS